MIKNYWKNNKQTMSYYLNKYTNLSSFSREIYLLEHLGFSIIAMATNCYHGDYVIVIFLHLGLTITSRNKTLTSHYNISYIISYNITTYLPNNVLLCLLLLDFKWRPSQISEPGSAF